MQGFLIDPEKRTIEPFEYNSDWRTIAPALGCELFTICEFRANGDSVYVDDEGLLNGPRHFFGINGFPQPLAGRGLILGIDEEGETIAARSTLEQLRRNLWFFEVLFTRPAVLSGGTANAKTAKLYSPDDVPIKAEFEEGYEHDT